MSLEALFWLRLLFLIGFFVLVSFLVIFNVFGNRTKK
jgi:hypothetical protein